MNIFKKLEELDFPLGEYVVVGSGPLAARGIREANDLDIAITEKLLKKLINLKEYKHFYKYGNLYLQKDKVEIITKLEWDSYFTTVEEAIKSADIINGFSFLSVIETIKFKEALGREKDYRDIKLLKKYIND